MTTDNDQAAVEALLRIFDDLHGDGDRATARAILDAIRKGEVPGVYDLAALRDARNAADYNRRCWEGVSADRDAEKARADKAEAANKLDGNGRSVCQGRARAGRTPDPEREAMARVCEAANAVSLNYINSVNFMFGMDMLMEKLADLERARKGDG